MQESARCFHNLEWPAPGARLAGPVVWLRGWIVGKPGHDFIDVRVRHGGGIHLGVLGLPRADLASHFKSDRPWLPAEFILGVPVNEGFTEFILEIMDTFGAWSELESLRLTISPDGEAAPRIEGRLETSPDGTWTVRDAHHPFHGHLDAPGTAPFLDQGRAPLLGWLLDETGPLERVIATTDGLVFNHVAHSLIDDSLAAKVTHPGARAARLRGAVDCPVTLPTPLCLRVYAVKPDGATHLCFAQRFNPRKAVPKPSADSTPYREPSHQKLPPLPSGRPRRLLLVTRSLLPSDATLRALDLARHLTAGHQWAARLVSTEDGPLRRDFEQADVQSLVVNPEPLFAAANESVLQQALEGLRRQIWWRHLDAVAVFDPVCGWAIQLARDRNIPVLFDCLDDEPMQPDPTAIPAVQTFLRNSWRQATAVCFGSAAAALAQRPHLGGLPAEIIVQWHTPQLPVTQSTLEPRCAIAPLRTVDWLARQHPAVTARWTFRQGPAAINADELLLRADDTHHVSAITHSDDWSVQGLSLCLGPLFGRGPLRPLLDAAASGVALAAPDTPTTREFFALCRLPLVDRTNPLALAHRLLEFDQNPGNFARESGFASEHIRSRHAPERLLPRWLRLLATVAANHG